MALNWSQEELSSIHKIFLEFADEIDADTPRYDDFGVFPNSIHKTRREQYKAIKILSEEVMPEIGDEGLNWSKELPEPELLYEEGDVKLYEHMEFILEFDEDSYQIGKNSENKWEFTRKIAEGLSFEEAFDQSYSTGSQGAAFLRNFNEDILDEDQKLPEEYRNDLRNLLDRADEIIQS